MSDRHDDDLRSRRQWRLKHGQYLGEISARPLLPPPPHSQFYPLLVGSGSRVTAYDVERGVVVGWFLECDGIRVHGIACCGSLNSGKGERSLDDGFEFTVAVYGEKRVKLFNLSARGNVGKGMSKGFGIDMVLVATMPRFGHLVLDVSFLKEKGSSWGGGDVGVMVAVGCTDNSVRLWSMKKSCIVLEISSPESCLLYSMRFWGENLEDLQIVSGSIYNECDSSSLVSHTGEKGLTCPSNRSQHQIMLYEATHICKLVGHEGSIFRIAWSSDGSKLISVSDDRSALVWIVDCSRECSSITGEDRQLFGHSARVVSDCFISYNVIVTAGEDCSCCVWGVDGKQLKIMKEHM